MDGWRMGLEKTAFRIALLGVNSQFVHSSLAPWCLLSGLKAYARVQDEAQVVEGTVNEAPEKLLERIADSRPDVLGIACYIWNIAYVANLLPLVRDALPDCVLILGGPEVSFRPQDTLERYPEVDYVLCGEGELPFARFMDAMHGLEAFEDVPGLCFRTAEGFHLSPPYQHEGMQPSPYTGQYFRQLNGRIAYLETSRGCPYACAFCLSGRGERLRQVPLQRAFDELLLLANSGARTVKLVDRTFNADRKRAREILQFLIEQEEAQTIPKGLTFHFEIAGDLLDEETLAVIARSPKGLFQFEIGLQSMDEATLRLVRRRTDMGYLKARVTQLIGLGTAQVHLDLIAGLPQEGLREFIMGFDEAYALRPHALQLGFLKLIHGSAMREEPEAYPCTFDREPPYQVRSTPWLSEADFKVLQTAEHALDKVHNAGRFQLTLRWLTEELRVQPFDLFYQLGQVILTLEEEKGRLSLEQLTQGLYEALLHLVGEKEALLRDLMLLDRFASTQTTVLPDCLKRKDKRAFVVKRALERLHPRNNDAMRAVGFLYAGEEEQVVWCDYEGQDPVTGLYPLNVAGVTDLI